MATFSSTSTRITISGTYKAFVSTSGSTSTVIQRGSGDVPATGDAGRFLLWQNGADTGDWEVRFIESATSSSVTVTDGGFSTSPGSGDTFVISTNLDDIDAAFAASVVRSDGRSYQIQGRDFELTSGAFVADVNASLSSQATSASNFAGTYPVADGCVLQFGRLVGGEANDSVETIGGCQIIFEVLSNNTLVFTTQAAYNSAGPVLNFYGCLLESIDTGGLMFIRAPGPMRIIGCVNDGPMGGRLYADASELVDTRFSGNTAGGVAWSLGAAFTRPIANAFFYQNNTAIKAFQDFTGAFNDCTFSTTNTQILDSSGAFSALLFQFIDCTTFLDAAISNNNGQYEQAKSINYFVADSSGTGLTGVKVAVYDTNGDIQTGIQTSASGTVPQINATFFRKDHGSTAVSKAPFDIRIRRYGYVYLGFSSSVEDSIKQEVRLVVNSNLVSSEAAAAAITGISLNFSTETITITENTTTQELYDYYQYQLDQTANMVYDEDLIRTGDSFDIDDWDMVVDGSDYEGNVTTTGTITLINSGTFSGIRTDSTGTTLAPVDIKITVNDSSGSAIQGARVYLELGSGGPGTEGDVLISDLTDSSGEVTLTDLAFVSNQAVVGRARKGSTSPVYKNAPISGTITSTGLDLSLVMVSDE